MKIKIGLILLILVGAILTLKAQERIITIKGVVYCGDKTTGLLQDVNIFNLKKGWGTTSDVFGQFEIRMDMQDTIYFSTIQHVEEKFYITNPQDLIDQTIEVEMTQDTTWLKVVNVIGFPTYEKFKQELLNLDLQSKEVSIAYPVINKYAQFENRTGDMELKIPLTYLFKKYVKILKRGNKKRN